MELEEIEIKIPTFEGDYEKWIEFRSIFETYIHNNPSLTKIYKFIYLLQYVKGEAESAVKGWGLTEENYNKAWEQLNSRYGNPNILVNIYLRKLFNLPTVTDGSYSQIDDLIIKAGSSVRALKYLKENVDQWDTVLIFMVVSKLDSATAREWYEHKSSLDIKPTFDDLKHFLLRYCNRKQMLEEIYGKEDSKDEDDEHCPICKNDSHPLSVCEKFKNLSPKKRISRARQLQLCFNCLGTGHKNYACKRKPCFHCHEKHNTLLHIE